MTKEEYYKSQLCAQAFREEVRKNHLLRQKLAGKDPESLQQAQEDREAFALVRENRKRVRMPESSGAKLMLMEPISEAWAEDIPEEPMGAPAILGWAVAAAAALAIPLLWVLG